MPNTIPAYMDLRKCPKPGDKGFIPFGSTEDCQTIGDLHGNALKLLNFLIMRGAAKFGSEDDYELFRQIYNTPIDKWDLATKKKFEGLLGRLQISPKANIRLLGDDLADRGENDYMTLALINHLVAKGANVEIMMSNHTALFVNKHEVGQKYSDIDLILGTGNARSAKNMHELIKKGVITQGEVNNLFKGYAKCIKIAAFDLDSKDRLQIYKHAPGNEIDILRMALCLHEGNELDDIGKKFRKKYVTPDHQAIIKRALNHAKGIEDPPNSGRKALDNQDVMDMIDMLNEVAQSAAEDGMLGFLDTLEIKGDPKYQGLYFGPAYGEKGNYPINNVGERKCPFAFNHWNREDPKDNQKGHNIRTKCGFHKNYGHVGEDGVEIEDGENADANVGRPGHEKGNLVVIVSKPVNIKKLKAAALSDPASASTLTALASTSIRPFKAPPGTQTTTQNQQRDNWNAIFGGTTESDEYFLSIKKVTGNEKDRVSDALEDARHAKEANSPLDDRIITLQDLRDAIEGCPTNNQKAMMEVKIQVQNEIIVLRKQQEKELEIKRLNFLKTELSHVLGVDPSHELCNTSSNKMDTDDIYYAVLNWHAANEKFDDYQTEANRKQLSHRLDVLEKALLASGPGTNHQSLIKDAFKKHKDAIAPSASGVGLGGGSGSGGGPPDKSPTGKLKSTLTRDVQIKYWKDNENLPSEVINGLEANEQCVGLVKAPADKSEGLTDLAKVYEVGDPPLFESNDDLMNKLNNSNVQMEIDGKSYYIRGQIKGNIVVFVKCENATDPPSSGSVISQAHVQKYQADKNSDSFSLDVMNKLGQELKKQPKYRDIVIVRQKKAGPTPVPPI